MAAWLFFLSGSIDGSIAAFLFTVAELTLAYSGHRVGGYAIAAICFSVGDVVLALSDNVVPGSILQMSLFCMAAAWVVGALRFPLIVWASKTPAWDKKGILQSIANALPGVCSSVNLCLRVPAILSGIAVEQYLVAFAIAAWGVADILAGRLQEKLSFLLDWIKKI